MEIIEIESLTFTENWPSIPILWTSYPWHSYTGNVVHVGSCCESYFGCCDDCLKQLPLKYLIFTLRKQYYFYEPFIRGSSNW